MSKIKPFRLTAVAALVASSLLVSACGGGSSSPAGARADDAPITPMSDVQLRVSLPARMQALEDPLEVIVTAAGDHSVMQGSDGEYAITLALPKNQEYPLFLRVQRSSDALIIASAQAEVSTSSDAIALALPPQLFTTDFDSDSDGFSNIAELERGSEPTTVSEDFDGDGLANDSDSDDDNDGIRDEFDAFPYNASEYLDTDNDGVGDNEDRDDDNDLILDVDDKFPLDANESLDLDLDGLGNSVDEDDDGDGTIDLEDPQPLNPNITGNEDTDGDGHPDRDDAFIYDPSEHNDNDGDGIGDVADTDDDNNGIPDDQDNSTASIPFTTRAPTIDGAFGWWEWQDAAQSDTRGNYLYIDHLLEDPYDILDDQNNEDYSSWRAMHDGEFLYILVQIGREQAAQRWSDSVDVWHDDSVEIFIDVGNDKLDTYGHDDYQRLFRYLDNAADAQIVGSNSAAGMIASYCSSRGMATDWGWYTYYEIKIDMSSINLGIGERFGIDVQYNDDDDSGSRDAKWAWFAPSGNDVSWQNPSLMGTGILAPEVVAAPFD